MSVMGFQKKKFGWGVGGWSSIMCFVVWKLSYAIDDCVISETDLRDQVEGSLNMHPSYETVVTRAQLALVSDRHSPFSLPASIPFHQAFV